MTIQEHMYRRFRDAGMTIAGACATLGQIQHEGAFRPNNAEDSKGVADDAYTRQVDNGAITRHQFMYDGIGYGYAQWTFPDRKGKMYDFHRARGKSIGDSETQIQFLIWEMQHDFPNQWNLVKSSNDLADCVKQLLYKWENPDNKEQALPVRLKSAESFYQQFCNLGIGGTSGMTKEEAINLVLNLARTEVGYHEKASNSNLDDKSANSGVGNFTKYARDLDALKNFYNGAKNGYAWCDVFYDWLFVKCFGAELGRQMLCQPMGSAGAGCLYSAQYYKQYGRWHTDNPEPGDQIFFSYAPGEYSHTGIVESVAGDIVNTIEGNSSDQVARKAYSIYSTTIVGFGRPKWELAANGGFDPGASDFTPTDRILKIGCRGDDVKKLQEDLEALGYDIGRWGADGDFGNDTMIAVMHFQTDRDIQPVDGEVGPDTRKALEEALKKDEEPEPKPQPVEEDEPTPRNHLQIRTLEYGMEGYDVKLAQSALQCWGYITIVSGIFGKEMDEKIRDFQKAKGLDATGIVDSATWKELLRL